MTVGLSCVGHKCTPAEQSYPTIKGELCAILHGACKFESFLRYNNIFCLVTDSSSIQYLHTMKTSSKLIIRWSLELAGFSYRMIHRKGSLNTNTDVLSRSEFLDEPTEQDMADQKQDFHQLTEHNKANASLADQLRAYLFKQLQRYQ